MQHTEDDSTEVQTSNITGTETDRAAKWFRALLAGHGVELHPESPFSRALNAVEYLAWFRTGQPNADIDPVRAREDALDVLFLAKAMHRSLDGIEPALGQRWKYFKSKDLCLSRDAPCSKERNTVWEILVVSLASQFVGRVDINGEPDVRFNWRRLKYGLACKVLYSEKPAQHLKQIQNGAFNIQANGRRGLVAANVTGLVDHEYFSGLHQHPPGDGSSDPDGRAATIRLRDRVVRIADEVDGKLNEKLAKARNVGGVVFFAHAAGEAPSIQENGARLAWSHFAASVFLKSRWVNREDEDFVSEFERFVISTPGYVMP